MTVKDYQDTDVIILFNEAVTNTASDLTYADDVVKASGGAVPPYAVTTPNNYKLKVLDGTLTNTYSAAIEFQLVALWTEPANSAVTYSTVLFDVFVPEAGSYVIDDNNKIYIDHFTKLQALIKTASGTGNARVRMVWVKG